MGAAIEPPSFSDKPATCLVVGAIFVHWEQKRNEGTTKEGDNTGGECVFSFEKTFVKTTGKKRFLCVFSLEKTFV